MGTYLLPSLFNGFPLSNQTSFQFSIYNLSVYIFSNKFSSLLLTNDNVLSRQSPDMRFESFQWASCSSCSAPT